MTETATERQNDMAGRRKMPADKVKVQVVLDEDLRAQLEEASRRLLGETNLSGLLRLAAVRLLTEEGLWPPAESKPKSKPKGGS